MIFYYSATGNTRYAASYLGKKLSQDTANILETGNSLHLPEEKEPIGLMFPIYCWGVPPVVQEFLENRLLPAVSSRRHLWAVCTCGDEAGVAMRQLNRKIKLLRGREADALWSLTMPNTYVMLPGFDVDSPEVEASKLAAAPASLDAMAGKIMERATGLYDVKEGSLPRLRSAIFPAFKKWGVTTSWWHAGPGCIGCGKCASICPARNIRMDGNRPQWGDVCFSCCACFHCCPAKAISYASFTKNKSQYLCPLK